MPALWAEDTLAGFGVWWPALNPGSVISDILTTEWLCWIRVRLHHRLGRR